NGEGREWWGTIVADPGDESLLPVYDLYCPDPQAIFSTGPRTNNKGAKGGRGEVQGCSMLFNGTFYDNLAVWRKGSTSLGWPKPKFRVSSNGQGKVLRTSRTAPYPVKGFSMSGNWAEPGGENTFFREPLVWEVFREMGVPSLISYQTHVRLNGNYEGRFIYVENWSEEALRRAGLPEFPDRRGQLWKAESGEWSSLRWDLKPEDVGYYWSQEQPKPKEQDKRADLVELSHGLAGMSSRQRDYFLFEALDLPRVINYMAAQTLILNQDRCTKNYFLYQSKDSGQWTMLPWDVESGFGIDRGLHGVPAPDYCILKCEQWNSPLYCDRNHYQDLITYVPWTVIQPNFTYPHEPSDDGGPAPDRARPPPPASPPPSQPEEAPAPVVEITPSDPAVSEESPPTPPTPPAPA
ncbi:hypothetical protein H632_c3499p0, partial [Helicosporidium sp. ATCC 50920]